MFKKSLTVIALAGAFVGSAMAANVTLYGTVDAGFQFKNVHFQKGDHKNTFKMEDGINTANHFGIKGEEQISDNLKVGFKLENGFDIRNGDMKTASADSTTLFDRESILFVESMAGTFAMGREGAISSGFGKFAKFGGAVSAMGNGRADVPGLKFVTGMTAQRFDNTVIYETPSIAGFSLIGQYANEAQGEHGYFDNGNDRFFALGATYKSQDLYGTFIVDQLKRKDGKNGLKFSFGGNVKATEDLQLFAAAQFFNKVALNVETINPAVMANHKGAVADLVKGFGTNLGASYKLGNGTVKGDFGFAHAKRIDADHFKLNRFIVAAGYDYALSKRTTVYTDMGAMFDRYKNLKTPADANGNHANTFVANVGMVHKF